MVLVEKWLTEDEYKEADDRGDIFSPDQEENNTQVGLLKDLFVLDLICMPGGEY